MVETAKVAIFYGVIGILIGALWRILVSIAGLPGLILVSRLAPDENWHDGSAGKVSWAGLMIVVLGQAYIALAFVAFVITFANDLKSSRPELNGWIINGVAVLVIAAPIRSAIKYAALKSEKNTNDVALPITWGIMFAGFLLFLFSPSTMKVGWPWVPYVR